MKYDEDDLQKYLKITELLMKMYVECSIREMSNIIAIDIEKEKDKNKAKGYDNVEKSKNTEAILEAILRIQCQYAIRIIDVCKKTEQIN